MVAESLVASSPEVLTPGVGLATAARSERRKLGMAGERPILVVDDDLALCATLIEQLAVDGEFSAHQADCAADAEARIMRGDTRYDAMILDVGLPDGDGRDLCARLRRHGIKAVIPVKEDQKQHRRGRGRAGGRPPAFDAGWYKQRNTVERCFSKLKQFRAVATRYDKRERIYQGTIDVASISIWLRHPVP